MAAKFVSALLRVPRPRTTCLCLVNARKSHVLSNGNMWRSRCGQQQVLIAGAEPLLKIQVKLTAPRRALHPILVLILRPLTRLLAALSGRYVRKWWRGLSPSQRKEILRKIRKRRLLILAVAAVVLLSLDNYYHKHVEHTPLTKRKRFMIVDGKSLDQLNQYLYSQLLATHKSEIVPFGHPFYQRVARVMNALIIANRDIPEIRDKVWALTVIDRPDITNAFCFCDGRVFVYTGMLNVCSNDEELALILSHEISHTILSHVAEILSKTFLVEALLFVPTFIFWFKFPDWWAIMTEGMKTTMAKLVVHLPFSRSLEREADVVGLLLAARACFDLRLAIGLWKKMDTVSASSASVEWLSTHPSFETRQNELISLLPIALKLREENNCPKLRPLNVRYLLFNS